MVLSQCVTSALFLGNMLRARKYRFALCFRALSNQYVERSAYANVFKLNRENKRFERAKVNSRCFHWFPAAILESLRWALTWRLHTKPYNFQWNLLPNNSSSEYRTSPKLWHVVYLLLFYDISISWLNILNGKRFYFSPAWQLSLLAWRENQQLENMFGFGRHLKRRKKRMELIMTTTMKIMTW